MFKLRRSKPAAVSPDIEAIKRDERAIEEQRRTLVRMLEDEPKRRELEQAVRIERAATLPPPDDLDDRLRRYRFEAQMTRRELRNHFRSQTRSALLFVLLVAATASLLMWMLRLAA